ncbi:Uncharacterized protein APZ42_000142, partial [Daphnia magna]
MKVGVPLTADCYERMLREGKFDGISLLLIACLTLKSNTFTVHFYRKMNMAKKYTHLYSDFSYQGQKCLCERDFLDAMKNGNRPTFTIDAFVYLQDNTVGWLRFIPKRSETVIFLLTSTTIEKDNLIFPYGHHAVYLG